jgi:hypothetical protein
MRRIGRKSQMVLSVSKEHKEYLVACMRFRNAHFGYLVAYDKHSAKVLIKKD